MLEIVKELNIEVSKPNVFQAVVAKQYDMNTRFIKATFVDSGDKIEIKKSDTLKVVINALRSDGESKGFDGVINDDGTVTVPLHSWMLELDGTVVCDISVIDIVADDGKKLTTTSFTLLVEKAAFGGSDITSDPQFDVLVALLDAATVAQEALDKSNEANSKYDACVEATENANNVRREIEEGGYIESLKEMNAGGKFSVWVGTHAEYDAIEDKDKSRMYIISDDPSIEEYVDKKVDASKKYTDDGDKVLSERLDYERGYTRIFSSDAHGSALGYAQTYMIDDNKIIGTLEALKMAMVRVAGQWVLCSVDVATDYTIAANNMIYISGCAPYTMIRSADEPSTLLLVDIRINISGPGTATLQNFSRASMLGKLDNDDHTNDGANVWSILLLNGTAYIYE